MNQIANISAESLPSLLDRAATALSSAKSSAEVLEARDFARVAYDAAKSAGRMARAKRAHDDVIGAVYRAQADALLIEARAKHKLADEYDAAQERGEVATRQNNPGSAGHVVDGNMPTTAADIGLRRDEIHEARKLRNAEAAEPGATARALDAIVARGDEPTKATLRREILAEKPAQAEAEPEEAPEAAKIRRQLSGLTREALVDDLIAAKLALVEAKAKNAALKAEVENLKADIAGYQTEDLGRALGNAQRQARTAEGRMREYQATAVRADRRAKILEAENARLKAEIENTMIPLN